MPGSIATAAHLTTNGHNGNANGTSNGTAGGEITSKPDAVSDKKAPPLPALNPDATPQQKAAQATRAVFDKSPDTSLSTARGQTQDHGEFLI